MTKSTMKQEHGQNAWGTRNGFLPSYLNYFGEITLSKRAQMGYSY
jgi:hypothetical protein